LKNVPILTETATSTCLNGICQKLHLYRYQMYISYF